MLEVLGVGFGRTGTLSLKAALEQLGMGPCHHMMEVFNSPGQSELWGRRAAGEEVPWSRLLDGYRATVDWPSVFFWRELLRDFPQARVILTVRDPQQWYESISRTIFRALSGPPPADEGPVRAQRIMARDVIVERTFQGRVDDRAHVIAAYHAHNAEVQRLVPPARLLVYDVRDGWEPLCGFLGAAVPRTPFPHANRSDEFRHGVGRVEP